MPCVSYTFSFIHATRAVTLGIPVGNHTKKQNVLVSTLNLPQIATSLHAARQPYNVMTHRIARQRLEAGMARLPVG